MQPVPSREALELGAALSQLSRNPRDVNALVNAGVAATKLGDFEAAVGFFKRGQSLAPTNPRLLAGLAGALVRQGDPASAVQMFAQAEAAGAPAQAIAADRGLAHDLIGDPVNAQRHYADALAGGIDVEEVTRRLAISQAIAGDAAAMEKTLLPLLKKQDKAAWRARAFGFAITGQGKEADRIVRTLLPASLASSITPYLQYMPRLTRAQQAAAANLGVFPRAADIGWDEPRIAALVALIPRDPGRALVPSGQPLGPARDARAATSDREQRRLAREAKARTRQEARLAEEQRKREALIALASSRQPRVAPPEIRPAREDSPPAEDGFTVSQQASVPPVAEILDGRRVAASPAPAAAASARPPVTQTPHQPQVAQAAPVPTPAAPPLPQPAVQPAVAGAAPATASASAPVAAPGFDLARLPVASSPAAPTPTSASTPVVAAPAPPLPAPAAAAPEPSFRALFADLGTPDTAPVPAAGAVDLRKIKPARPQPKPAPEPEVKKPPSHPSRIWVQLGIGQKLSALYFDWRKLEKAYPALLKGRKPYTARLGQTNRLLTGPFPSQKEASQFMNAMVKAGALQPMVWTSPAGEVVDDLGR
ncbi:MAG: tetratricopeptide repeat protein [Alphaproteobacteria bacterium]|nr:tetratricopeptide repeat protein [Alphaproteobacteria bacterium]